MRKTLSNIFTLSQKLFNFSNAFVQRHPKLLVLGLYSFFTFCLLIFRLPASLRAEDINLDSAWYSSLSASLQQGDILGRDIYFSYGPLAQLLAQFGLIFRAGGTALDGFTLSFLAFGVFSQLLLALVLFLLKSLDWKRTLLILVVNSLLNFPAPRQWLSLLCVLALWAAITAATPRRRYVGGFLSGFLCLLAQLFILDAGIYGLVACGLVLACYAVFARFPEKIIKAKLLGWREYLGLLLALFGGYLLANLLLSLVFLLSSSNYSGFFDYQFYSIEFLRSYNYALASPWAFSWLPTLVLAVVVVYNLVFIVAHLRSLKAPDGLLLFGIMLLALLQLKSAIVRSDVSHIMGGVILALFMFMLAGIDWRQKGRIKFGWWLILLLVLAIWPGLDTALLRDSGKLLEDPIVLQTRLQVARSQRLAPQSLVLQKLIDTLGADKAILSFPYENQLAIGLGRRLVAPFLQAYAAQSITLQEKYVNLLDKQKNNTEVIYGLDTLSTIMLDGVPQVTRLPLIFEYLYRNYELKSPEVFGKGYVVLRPRPQPVLLKSVETPFSTNQAGNNWNVKLNQPAQCAMIKLSARLSYPLTSQLGRPDPVRVRVYSGPEESRVARMQMVSLAADKEFSTYLSLIDPKKFYTVFGPNPTGLANNWDTLSLSPDPTGLFGVSFSKVEVTKVECVNFN